MLDAYLEAFWRKDIDQIVSLLTAEAVWEMPPFTGWYRPTFIRHEHTGLNPHRPYWALRAFLSSGGTKKLELPVALHLFGRLLAGDEHALDAAGVVPDRIMIFRNPTLRMCEDEDEVVDEVRITVVHEIAHHFGIDDDRLHELGYA